MKKSARKPNKTKTVKKKPTIFRNKKLFGLFIIPFITIGLLLVFSSNAYIPSLKGNDGKFTPLSPARVFDQTVSSNSTTPVQITGQGGIPTANVRAVVANITIDAPTQDGFLTVYPSGAARPNASTINFSPSGGAIANQIQVGIGADGRIQIYNPLGSVRVMVDISGYYSNQFGQNGKRFIPLDPFRIYDAPVKAGDTARIPIRGKGGVPLDDVSAVVVNVTIADQNRAGFVTLYPSGEARPSSSTINFNPASGAVANQVTVKVGADGTIAAFNPISDVRLILDVSGYYTTRGTRFVPMTPQRLNDSGYGEGQTKNFKITGKLGIPPSHVKAVLVNITAAGPTKPGFIAAYPGKTPAPNVSSLNFLASTKAVANQLIVKVGTDGTINVLNPLGGTRVILDIGGYFLNNDELEVIEYNESARMPNNANLSLKLLKKGVKYGPSPSHTFDIYDSVNRATRAAANKDTIVWFFGGGWEGGDNLLNTPYDNIAKHLAAEYGYKLVSASYRKSGEAPYPAQYQDGIAVIKYLKANAKTLDIDPNRIIIGGFSAGGDIAATAAMGHAAPHLQPTYLSSTVARQSALVRRIITFGIPFDKVAWANNPHSNASPLNGLNKLVQSSSNGSAQQNFEAYSKLSIVQYATPDDPPHYTVMSKTDEVIPYNTQINAINIIGDYAPTILQIGGPFGHVSGIDTNIAEILEFLR